MQYNNPEAEAVLKPRRKLVHESALDGDKTGSINMVSKEQDVIVGFAQAMLRNFLQERGFDRTLSVFDTELKKLNYEAPSVKAWYDMSTYLDIPGLCQQNKRRTPSYPSLLEILIKEMVESKLGTVKKPVRRRASTTKPAIGSHSRTRLEPLAHIDVPADKLKVTSTQDKVAAEKKIRDDARKESQRARAASSKFGLKSQSVHDLQMTLEKSLGPSKKKQQAEWRRRKAAKKKIESGIAANEGKDAMGSPISEANMEPNMLVDLDEDLDEATVTRNFMARRSNESWIPWDVRFKMLRKNMQIQKENALDTAIWDDLLEKNEVDLDYLSIARSQEKYSGKNKKKCALCCLEFLNVNLPLKISLKAVLDLRTKWGLTGGDDGGMLAKVPRCYDKVSTCRYCSQFFHNTESYRPLNMGVENSHMGPHSLPPASSPSQKMSLSKQFLLGTGGKSMSELRQSNRTTVEIFAAGDGKSYPKKGDWVILHYSAYLSGGTMFDSSRDRHKPLRFRIGAEQVIKGLNDGVSQLSVGERAKVIIPPSIGFGENGLPGLVPGNAVLIYDVELLSFSEH